ncbi:MAG TPA: ATP-dependent RNA helicase HrpA [Iamia sp.]|nr:ATP-dependent RNA helicase HrpA [Iamia sp.]
MTGPDPRRRRRRRPDRTEDPAAREARLARRRARLPVPTYPAELPITERHDELLAAIRDHQVVIVAGETGSGKSTQLPKLCLELGRGVAGLIGHTQPRRVAARTIAERVAEELGTELGDAVGYTVRFTDRVSDDTFVKVMTDGILLAELPRDRLLRRYDTLIIDEAHERSLNIDFLLGYLHQLLPQRPDLKVVITSATIDTERFSAHFDDAPIIEVSGRTFPVELRYRPYGELVAAEEGDDVIDDDRDQVDAVCDAVAELAGEGPGDILVFLSGEREIHDTADALAERDLRDTDVLPLYARLSAAEQQRVFAPHGRRRVVLATNVAETSLTVPGVRYVVDAGTARISRYSHRLKVQRLPIEKISQASADQRAGRCGRVAPGICIRLYSEEDLAARPEFTDPEILRTNLASVILQMTDLRLGDVSAFPFIDPPDPRSIRDGVALLEELGALADGAITPVGRQLVRLPIDPRLGRMVLEAQRQGCVREAMVIAAALSIQDVRERPADQRAQADQLHARFSVPGSDLLSLVALWDHLEERRRELTGNRFRREVKAEHLNFLRIREWRDLHRQVERAARPLGIVPGEEEDAPAEGRADRVHRAVLAGLLSQIGMRDRDTREFRGARGARFQIAAGSVLARKPPAWVMAAELVETNRLWARGVATIRPEWVEELAGPLLKRSHGDVRWDERSARAVVTERATLYGLPVVGGRTVGLDRVDPEAARELFVDHALVRREWETRHGFVAANEAFLDEARALGDRLRRDDLFDHDETLRRFYDARVGAEVVSGRHFDRWWKEVRRTDPERLTLRLEDLVGDDPSIDLAGHPDHWHQGDLTLDLTYRYAPGDDLDGATVHIPLPLLDRVEPWDFDWQIPAYRRELVVALAATLPKARRRELAPFGPTVAEVADALALQERPLAEALAAALSARSGTRIDPAELDARQVPAHLRLTFAVDDADGTTIAFGKDLDAVRELVGGRVRRAVADAVTAAHPDLADWEGRDLPRVVRAPLPTGTPGNEVVGHPALLDDGEGVTVAVLTRPEVADRVMAAGLRRLVLTRVPVGIRGLAAELPDEVRRALVANDLGVGLGGLLRDVVEAAAGAVVDAHGGITWTAAGRAAIIDGARAELRATASRALADAGAALVAATEVEAWLGRLGAPRLARSTADARAHLGRLVRPGFAASAGPARLPDVARYVRGIALRLEKLAEAPDRDEARMAEVAAVERSYRDLLGALRPDQVTPRVVAAGWLLEELRVGVFAQALGTRERVSAPRVRAEVEALWSGELD